MWICPMVKRRRACYNSVTYVSPCYIELDQYLQSISLLLHLPTDLLRFVCFLSLWVESTVSAVYEMSKAFQLTFEHGSSRFIRMPFECDASSFVPPILGRQTCEPLMPTAILESRLALYCQTFVWTMALVDFDFAWLSECCSLRFDLRRSQIVW
jgi:hypothetical protein